MMSAIRRKFSVGVAIATLSLPALTLAGGAPREGSPLIGLEALQRKLGDANVRLLDARPRADYDRGHIRGAVWVDAKVLQGLSGEDAIKVPAAWSRALAPLGLGPEIEEVYVYDAARQHDAARAWWLLSYAGIPEIGLVDGGFLLWERERRPISTESADIAPREFTPAFRADRLATRAFVREAAERGVAQLLDARSAEEYRGEKAPRNQAKAGHIPTARSLDGYALVDADGRFVGPAEQHRLLQESAIAPNRPAITYSLGRARSAIATFALERLGIPMRHYVFGLSNWLGDPEAAILGGGEPGQAIK